MKAKDGKAEANVYYYRRGGIPTAAADWRGPRDKPPTWRCEVGGAEWTAIGGGDASKGEGSGDGTGRED